jgi:hypothetical protein
VDWLPNHAAKFQKTLSNLDSSFFFFFFIKCKNQKEAGDQQYKEKETKSLDQIRSKTSLLNRRQREQTPLYKPQARQAC